MPFRLSYKENPDFPNQHTGRPPESALDFDICYFDHTWSFIFDNLLITFLFLYDCNLKLSSVHLLSDDPAVEYVYISKAVLQVWRSGEHREILEGRPVRLLEY